MRIIPLAGVGLALALLAGCSATSAVVVGAEPSGTPTVAAQPSSPPTQVPSPTPTATAAPSPVPSAAPLPVPPPVAAPAADPVKFWYSCRLSTAGYDLSNFERFETLDAVWADPRDLFCNAMQTGTVFSQVELDAEKLFITSGGFATLYTQPGSGVLSLYYDCANKTAVDDFNANAHPPEWDRIVIEAFLMVCPAHPEADQLRLL